MNTSFPTYLATFAAILFIVPLSLGCGHETATSGTALGAAMEPELSALSEAQQTSPVPAAAAETTSAAEPAGATEQPKAEPEPTTPEPAPQPTRPKADRTPRKPGEAEKITFDDLIIGMQANIVYRPWMLSERAQELDGTRVRVPGAMHGGAAGSSGIKEFILLRNKECKFGKDGQADHLAMVTLLEGTTTTYAPDLIVEGTLRIDPYTGSDGNTWAIYKLEDAVVK